MNQHERRRWLSIRQGIEHGKIPRSTLLALALKKELEVAEFGGRLFVSAESLDAYRRKHPRVSADEQVDRSGKDL